MSLISNINKKIGSLHLQIDKWQIADLGVTALVGPSGAGKTTLFRILIGLESCPGFSWDFKGVDLAKLSVQDRRLGVVFQNYELFPHLTAKENILFAAESRSINKKEANKDLDLLLSRLQLEKCQNTKAEKLSGGEKQRTSLARALIARPQFLLLDEPFSALDLNLRVQARKLVKEILLEFKVPALLISHDETDICEIADSIAILEQGHLELKRSGHSSPSH